jgi:RNA polymerase sigma-70 factor, ECF subfamily
MSQSERVSHCHMVELARRGNNEAFTMLFRQYEFGIYGYLMGLIGNSEDARDLAQETFFKAWEEIPNLLDPLKFKPWLYRIARNLAYDQGRRKKRLTWYSYEETDEKYLSSSQPELGEHLAQKELIKATLAMLPWKHRECLLLQIEGGLPPSQIAEIVGISKESVSTYLCNARRQFRELYRRQENEQGVMKQGSQFDE